MLAYLPFALLVSLLDYVFLADAATPEPLIEKRIADTLVKRDASTNLTSQNAGIVPVVLSSDGRCVTDAF